MLSFLLIFLIILIPIVILTVWMTKKDIKKSKETIARMQNSPTVSAIWDYMVSTCGGPPTEIFINILPQVYFGPVNGSLQEVPRRMVPSMQKTTTDLFAAAIAEKYGYSHASSSDLHTGIYSIDEPDAYVIHLTRPGVNSNGTSWY